MPATRSMSFPTRYRPTSSRPRGILERPVRSGHYGRSCAHSSGAIPKICRFPKSGETLSDVIDCLRLAEIIAVPDMIRGPEVVGRTGKLQVRDAEIDHRVGVDHKVIRSFENLVGDHIGNL